MADRWHILKNLTDALERFFLHKTHILKLALGTKPAPKPIASLPPQRVKERKLRLSQQIANYHKVHALRTKKVQIAAIADQVKISRPTIYRYLSMSEPPGPRQPNRDYGDKLAQYKPYLIQRWQEGCHNGHQLAREVQELSGSRLPAYSTVANFTKLLRRGEVGRFSYQPLVGEDKVVKKTALTAHQAALVCVFEPAKRKEWQQEYLERLCQLDDEVKAVYELASAFTTMLRQRQPHKLDEWLKTAHASPSFQIRGFAKGVKMDYAAVKAGLTLEYSQGQVEGHNHRLKMLKRQMFGRAGFELLRKRVLYRPNTSLVLVQGQEKAA